MVRTLMKHEFVRTRSALALIGVIPLLLVLVGWALGSLSAPVGALTFGLGIVSAFALPLVVQLYLAVDLYKSTFGRRGYLTHTLPVEGRTLVLTKTLHMLLVCLATLLWSVLLLVLSGWSGETMHAWRVDDILEPLRWLWAERPGFVAFGLCTVVGLYLVSMTYYVFAVTVGSEAWINRHGGIGPVVTFVILYAATQVLGMLAFLIPPNYNLTDGSIDWSLPITHMVGDPEDAFLPISMFLIGYVIGAVLIWRSVVSVTRKLELR